MEGKSSDWRPGPTVCRCCLSEGCYKDISTEYFWMGRREVYSEMLSETLDLSIAYSNSSGPNSNSRLICEQCISRLRDASEFKRQVIDCEKTFMQHLNPGSSSKSKDYLTVETIGDVKLEAVKREKESLSDDDYDDRADFLDVDSDDDLDNQPLTKLASKIPKKEAIDILDLLDNSQITVKRKSNLKTKEPPKKILKKKETKAAPRTVSKAAPKQADKKKDEEWTSTEVNIKIPVEFENSNSASKEWITTDSPDHAHTAVSKVKQEYCKTVDVEWVTLPLNAAELPPAVKSNYNLDDDGTEWVITDIVKHDDTVQTSPNSKKSVPKRPTRHQQNNMEGVEFVSKPVPKDLPAPELVRTMTQQQNNMKRVEFVSKPVPKDLPAPKLIQTMTQQQNNMEGYEFVSKPGVDLPASKVIRSKRQQKKNMKQEHQKWDRVPIKGPGEMWLKVPKNPKALLDATDKNAVLLIRHTTALPCKMENRKSIIPCFACEQKFLDPFQFRDHFIAEHPSVDKVNGFYSKFSKTRVDITDLSCLLCTQVLDNLEEAAAHLVQMHKIGIDLNEKLGLVPLKFPERGLYQCAVCGKAVVTFRDLYRHSGSHFSHQICEVCGMQFESTKALKLHTQSKHIKGRLCIKCKVVFPSDKELSQHLKEVRSCNQGYCKICDKAFGYYAALQRHREAEHGFEKKVYPCSVCQTVFDSRIRLYFHFKQQHTDSYKCEICNKKLSGPTMVKKHMRTHVGRQAQS